MLHSIFTPDLPGSVKLSSLSINTRPANEVMYQAGAYIFRKGLIEGVRRDCGGTFVGQEGVGSRKRQFLAGGPSLASPMRPRSASNSPARSNSPCPRWIRVTAPFRRGGQEDSSLATSELALDYGREC